MECKYCKAIIPKNRKGCCDRCYNIFKLEYKRLWAHIKRKNIKDLSDLMPNNCPYCYKWIIGRRVCRECSRLRDEICETLINEVNEGIKHG